MSTVQEALARGTRHHQAGQLAEAESLYRQVLSVDPGHPHALHQLGMLSIQSGKFDQAIELITRAIRADRTQPAFYANLGEAYRHLGRRAEAIESYRRAIKLQPRLVQAHRALGGLLHDEGRTDEAVAALREALRLAPEDCDARTRLAQVLEAQEKLEEAEACYRRVVRDNPHSAQACFNLGTILGRLQRHGEAAEAYQAALQINPQFYEAHHNLGTTCKELRDLERAEQHCREAVRLKPDRAECYVNLGLLHFEQGRFNEAADALRAALELDRDSLVAWQGLGVVLERQGNRTEAAACFQEVLRRDPTYAAAHLGLGYLHDRAGQKEQAIVAAQEALRHDPLNSEAHNNLAVALAGLARHDEAIAAARRAIELDPRNAAAHSNLAVSQQAIGLVDEAIVNHRRAVDLSSDGAGYHSNLLYALNYAPQYDPETLFAEHRAWGARWADPLTAAAAPHAPDRSSERRLRLGYVSPHFRTHAVNFFTEPILTSHDHTRFEVFCYSDVEIDDDTTRRLRNHADHWRDTRDLDAAQLAELVRRDQIDILVDLTGHIAGGKRLLAFARKPAPIQVTYIGYQNTTGMRAMDYRLTDAYADPPGETGRWHTEQLVRLDPVFYCYQPSHDAPAVVPPPALSAGHVTFGSINNFTKVTRDVLRAWAEILARVPGSRLLLRADMTDSLRARLLETFAGLGIASERLELATRVPRAQYLELIQRTDIALDPFPFNGHTTTCDCLWQGVPVVTWSGRTYVSRFGGSGLAVLGLRELIARSRDEYLEIAVRLAADLDRLRELRATMRERMAASPILDFVGFTRRLEAQYRRMWHDWLTATTGR